MKITRLVKLCVYISLIILSPSAMAEDWFSSITTSALASLIGWIAALITTGVGVYAIMTFILGNFQFLLGFMFAPIGLLLMPLDKGRVLSSTVSMMLTGITIFVVAFTVLLITVDLFQAAAQKLSEAAIRNGEGGAYKLTFALASIIYSYIMYQIVQQANSWGASLFGGVGFDLGGMVRSMGRGAGSSLGKAGSMANNGGGAAIGALGRGTAGGIVGGISGAKAGKDGAGTVKGMFSGAGKGAGHAIRGRGGELSKKPPAVGSGMRLSDSFKAGGQAATQSSKVSSKGKELLSKPSVSKEDWINGAHGS